MTLTLFTVHQAKPGDLTTSNLLFNISTQDLIWIDFGQSQTSALIEDKAVDLALLEKCVTSTHSLLAEPLFKSFISGYTSSSNSKAVLTRLEKGHFY
jgi:TP53 regulating kinase and related kinases